MNRKRRRSASAERLIREADAYAKAVGEAQWTNGYRAAYIDRGNGATLDAEDGRLYAKELAQWALVGKADIAFQLLARRIADLQDPVAGDADTARLDWLEDSRRGMEYLTADDHNGEPTRHFWMVDDVLPDKYRITIREAIDAAMNPTYVCPLCPDEKTTGEIRPRYCVKHGRSTARQGSHPEDSKL